MKNCAVIKQGEAFLLDVDGRTLPLYAYMTYQPEKGRYRDFLDAGVRLVSVAVYAGDRGINPSSGIRPFRPGFMAGPGVYDFQWVEQDFRGVYPAAPDAGNARLVGKRASGGSVPGCLRRAGPVFLFIAGLAGGL